MHRQRVARLVCVIPSRTILWWVIRYVTIWKIAYADIIGGMYILPMGKCLDPYRGWLVFWMLLVYIHWVSTTVLPISLSPLSDYSYVDDKHSSSLGFAEAVGQIPMWAFISFSKDGGTWDPSVSSATAAVNTGSWTTTLSRSFADASSTTAGNPSVETGRVSVGGSRASESSISAQNTGTATASYTSTSSSDRDGDSNDSSTSHSIPLGPVIGGVAGGLVGVIILFLLWRWYVNGRHRLANPYSPSSTPPGFGGGVEKEKQKKKKRMTYPYPAKTRGSLVASAASVFGSGGGVGRDEERGEGRGRSFLDMLVGGKGDGSGNWKEQRDTALYSDPTTFTDPRKAPEPYSASRTKWRTTSQRLILEADLSDSESAWSVSDDNGGQRKKGKWKEAFIPSIAMAADAKKKGSGNSRNLSAYTTTSQRQRLARRTLTPSEMEEDEETPFPLSARPESVLTPIASTDTQPLSTATHPESKNSKPTTNQVPKTSQNNRRLLSLPPKQPPPAHLPPPTPDEAQSLSLLSPLGRRVDFSQPPSIRRERISENPTLPSLYEPPTGARTYRASRGSEMFSPGSRYMGTIYGDGGHGDRARGGGEGRRFSEGTIGATLGSARSLKTGDGRARWSGESAPPLPTPKPR